MAVSSPRVLRGPAPDSMGWRPPRGHLPTSPSLSHSGISVNIQDLAPSCAGFLFGESRSPCLSRKGLLPSRALLAPASPRSGPPGAPPAEGLL